MVCSSGVPSGMSMITWNSLLLSNGSILTCTHFSGMNATAASSSTTTPPRNIHRRPGIADQRIHQAAIEPRGPAFGFVLGLVAHRRNDAAAAARPMAKPQTPRSARNTIAAEAPTGMGRMYGPINPRTKAMGRIAAITANVARIVGLPTSSTASTATSAKRAARDFPAGGNGARCFRPRRWRRPPECRWKRSARKA